MITGLVPWTRRVGGEFGINIKLPSGCYSDDTQLRLATSRSIRGDGVFDVEIFSKVEIPVWLSYSLGAGRATKTAAESLRKQQIQWNSNFYKSKYAQYIDSGGNGAAMRIQPHIWCAMREKQITRILKDVIRNTITTHGHSRAIVGSAFHASCLRKAILTTKVPDLADWRSILEELRQLPDIIHSDEELTFHWLPEWEKETGQRIEQAIYQSLEELLRDVETAERIIEKHKSYDTDTVRTLYTQVAQQIGCLERSSVGSATKTALLAAYLSYISRDHPHNGLVEATNLLGSDTDTISTMAGAIMGVTATTDPPEQVLDARYLEKEAIRLYEISQGHNVGSYAHPDLLYWKPPNSQIDALGQYKGKWVLKGLGLAEPISDPIEQGGKYPVVWQWFRLEFGQTILAKRRTRVKTFAEKSMPVKSRGIPPRTEPLVKTKVIPAKSLQMGKPEQARLWDDKSLAHVRHEQRITVELATNIAIRSGFREDVVGSMLMKLAEQDNGIKKSIAFASIIAKAKQARMNRER